MNKIVETNGTLRISREVLAAIAKSAALEIDGVYSIAEAPVVMRNMLKGNYAKPITVSIKDDIAEIGLQIIINSGKRISNVSEMVQKSVKEAIQSMTGIAVSKVNVVIAGVNFANSAATVK